MPIGVPVRRSLVAGLAVALAVLPTVALPAAGWAAPAAAITPGVELQTPAGGDVISRCTAGFVVRSADNVFLAYAAHCTSLADASGGIDGCTEPALPLGTPVTVLRTDRSPTLGSLAYSSWLAMQDNRETEPDLCLHNDLALVALDPKDVGSVDPTVPVFGGPEGLDTDGTHAGELLFSYQPNVGRAAPARQGITLGGSLRNHDVVMVPPPEHGDSGSGYLDAGGRAVGLLSSGVVLPVAGRPADVNGVSDLAAALDYASEHGGLGRVELVAGTAPFARAGLPVPPVVP
jgi:hypothetical protein